VNKCHFLGKLTHDPEVKIENNVSVINFELEIEEFRKDNNREKVRSVTYLNFEAWDSAAEAIEKYAKKGSLMAIESVARNFFYKDKNEPEELIETYFRVTNFKILGIGQ